MLLCRVRASWVAWKNGCWRGGPAERKTPAFRCEHRVAVLVSDLPNLLAMKLESFLLPAFVSLVSGLGSTTAPTVIDLLSNVSYTGYTIHNVDKFLSIYYAQDTSGSNRFAAPRPFVPEPGTVFNNTTPGPACPQPLGDPTVPVQLSAINAYSEDCLHLNIARPLGTGQESRLPVMVFIHGGERVGKCLLVEYWLILFSI